MAVARLFRGPFTVDDYQRLGECGILHEDSRVELIDGQVVPMSPIGERHAGRVNYLTETLVRTVQNPVTLDRRSQPQPDLAIVRRRPEFFGQATPTVADTLLIIEVADSSVEYDREVKVPLYARAGPGGQSPNQSETWRRPSPVVSPCPRSSHSRPSAPSRPSCSRGPPRRRLPPTRWSRSMDAALRWNA